MRCLYNQKKKGNILSLNITLLKIAESINYVYCNIAVSVPNVLD